MPVLATDELSERIPSGPTITVRKCIIRRGMLVARGEPETISLKEAVARLAPSGERGAKLNVLNAKVNSFIGLLKKRGRVTNFVVSNPTSDGDIRWLLFKYPELPDQVVEVYRIEDVYIPKTAVDLPGDPERV